MIGLPFNDLQCLGSITEVVAEMVKHEDPVIAEIAAKHPTTGSLVAWIRTLPQRDDEGHDKDGPKVEACDPPQRLRIPAPDPNCLVMQSYRLCGAGNDSSIVLVAGAQRCIEQLRITAGVVSPRSSFPRPVPDFAANPLAPSSTGSSTSCAAPGTAHSQSNSTLDRRFTSARGWLGTTLPSEGSAPR